MAEWLDVPVKSQKNKKDEKFLKSIELLKKAKQNEKYRS